MKILVVTNMFAGANPVSPSQGIFVSEQVNALRRLPNVEVDVEVVKGFDGSHAYLTSMPRIIRTIIHGRYDVIHYHFGLTAWSAPLVRMFTKAKIVVTLHGSDVCGPRWMRLISSFSSRFCDVVVAVSKEIAIRTPTISRKSVTIPCGVDVEFFKPEVKLRQFRSTRLVIFPSSPDRPEKDYNLFKQVLEKIRLALPELNIEERWIDKLSRAEVKDLLQRAHVLILTSKREGSPQVVKEAMACALPVVAVNVGDVAKLLGGVEQCFVSADRDSEAISTKAVQILSSTKESTGPERLREFGYTESDVVNRLMKIYQSILN
ncbi:glycosyltransferase [Paraburkholderia silviterrae]|uniref:Glycosyltransferase n=1 Tax=Paraburkholderia silviterrae TaxID=2528715 RepID=A0A4R5MCV7_9BURK|nr:glycosyltransferase [Paraburkholderia silviterrae]TDG24433.1 glycosyltransferase [Paraburkholderia silviterrae]